MKEEIEGTNRVVDDDKKTQQIEEWSSIMLRLKSGRKSNNVEDAPKVSSV